MWKIYKNGSESEIRCEIRKIEYQGMFMGESYVSVNIESPVHIDFVVGDYFTYRGEIFKLKNIPEETKVSSSNSYNKAFQYNSVKFCGTTDDLTEVEFLDYVINDNKLHFTSLPEFSFYCATIQALADRIQANLDRVFTGNSKWTVICNASNVSISNRVIQASNIKVWDALGFVSSVFKSKFIVRGRTITIGNSGNVIPHIFKYGKGNGATQIKRNTDISQEVITRLHAYGNTTNLPSLYYSTIGAKVNATITELSISDNTSSVTVSFHTSLPYSASYLSSPVIINIGGVDMTCTIDGVDKYYNTSQTSDDAKAALRALNTGDSVTYISGVKISAVPSQYKTCTSDLPNNMAVMNLMLPAFPNKSLQEYWDSIQGNLTDAQKERYAGFTFSTNQYEPYINAPTLSTIGIKENSHFFNSDDEDNEDIYPSMKYVTATSLRSAGHTIDLDSGDNGNLDEIASDSTETDGSAISGNGVYAQGSKIPQFIIYLKDIGFNFNDVYTGSPFKINMQNGLCGGREFECTSFIKVGNKWKLTCNRTEDIGLYFPYSDYNIKAGDKFVITGINMPKTYVDAASFELLIRSLEFVLKNDYTRYTYSPVPDAIKINELDEKEGTNIHDTIKEGDLLTVQDDDLGISDSIIIDTLKITEGDSLLPKYEITLNNNEKTQTALQKTQSKISSMTSGDGIGGYTLQQITDLVNLKAGDKFLSKTKEDTAQELITFLKGTKFGTFVSGLTGTGGYIDGNGNAELQSLILRAFLEVPELRYNRVTVQAGNRWRAAGGGVVESVTKLTDTTGEVTLHLVSGDYGKIAVGDICMGIYHDGMTTANNFGEDYDDRQGNFKFKGFFTAYFTVTEITETGSNSKFKYSLRDTNGNWKFAFHPCEAMQFVCYGNFTNTSRQACVYETLTYSRLLRNVNTWEFSRANIGLQYGDLTGLSHNGNNLTGYGLYAKDNIYFEGAVIQLSPEQISEIASEAGGYSAHVSKNSDTIDVDDNGYPTTSLVTSDSGVSTYRLRSTMNVNRGSDILLYSSTAGVAGTYSAILQCKGCTADIANGTVRILTITGLNDGTSSYNPDVMKALTECSVDIQINCEGEVILQQTYTVTINHVASYYKLDLTNENSSVNCDKDGTVIGTFETSQALIYKGASTDTGWTLAISDADGATASMADGLITVTAVTKDITSIKIAATKTGFATLYATYTITKVYAGKDGTAAVNYSLIPSVSVVKVDKLAAYSASTVSCGLARTTGANREVLSAVPDEYTFKYSINNGTSFRNYTLGSSVDMTTVTTALVFELLDSNSKVVDLETIPLLKDGSDGKDYEYIYMRSTTETTPSTPATSQTDDYVPSGWTDDPSGVTSTYKYEYISTRQKVNGTWGAFSTPAIWARYAADGATGQTGATGATGANGRGIDNVVKRYLATSASSGVTSSSGSWSYSMVTPTSANKYLWCWTNTYYTDGTYDVDYEIIAVCGQDGSSGSSGNNGCVIRTFENGFVSGQTYRNDTNYYTSGVRYLDFILVENSSYASGYKVYQTVTTHSYANGDESNSNYFTEVSTNAASAFFNYIVAKDASIKMLTGSFIGVKDSRGNIVAGLIGGNFPIFAGSSTPSSAPFRVGTDGSFYSNNATVTGTFTMYLNSYNFVNIEVKSRTFNSSSINTNIYSIADDTAAFFATSSGTCLRLFSSNSNGYAIRSIGSVDLTNNNGGSVYINGLCLKEATLSNDIYLTNDGDNYIYAGSSNITVNLPTSPHIGKIITIRKIGTGNITVRSNKSMYTSFGSPSSNNSVNIINGRTVIFRYWDIASCWTANFEENW